MLDFILACVNAGGMGRFVFSCQNAMFFDACLVYRDSCWAAKRRRVIFTLLVMEEIVMNLQAAMSLPKSSPSHPSRMATRMIDRTRAHARKKKTGIRLGS